MEPSDDEEEFDIFEREEPRFDSEAEEEEHYDNVQRDAADYGGSRESIRELVKPTSDFSAESGDF